MPVRTWTDRRAAPEHLRRYGPGGTPARRRVTAAALAALAVLAVAAVLVAGPAGPAAARQGPGVLLSAQRAAPGATLTVSGAGWRPGTLLTLLICGQNMIGGTNACANADGRAVTTDASGSFSAGLPVVAPPRPCPCVVHVATVTGERHAENAVLAVAGHPTAPLPRPRGPGKLAALTTARLEGDSGLLVLFGAPPSRRLSLTVGNLGTTPVENPVFRLGVSHGVYAPRWEERRWRGTIAPGAKARITLDVELAAGAHGDYGIAVRYAGRTIADRPWDVGRPWGVTAFWVLLALVAPAAVFRVGMAVVDHLRPAGPAETTAAGKAKDRRPGGVPGQRPCRCGGESGGSGGSGGSGPAGQPGTGVS